MFAFPLAILCLTRGIAHSKNGIRIRIFIIVSEIVFSVNRLCLTI